MMSKKGLVIICVLALLIFSAQFALAENSENQGDGESKTMEQLGENYMLHWRYCYRNEILEGVENNTVVKECNISKKAGKLYVNSYEYQKGMTLEVKEQSQYKLQIKVSAEFKEGKVLVLNIEDSVFKVKNSQQLKVKFDNNEMNQVNIDEVMNGNGTEAEYTAALGEGGGQYLVYIPHFSEHLISFEIIDETTGQSMNFILGALGIALLTILVLSVIIIKIGKCRNDE